MKKKKWIQCAEISKEFIDFWRSYFSPALWCWSEPSLRKRTVWLWLNLLNWRYWAISDCIAANQIHRIWKGVGNSRLDTAMWWCIDGDGDTDSMTLSCIMTSAELLMPHLDIQVKMIREVGSCLRGWLTDSSTRHKFLLESPTSNFPWIRGQGVRAELACSSMISVCLVRPS